MSGAFSSAFSSAFDVGATVLPIKLNYNIDEIAKGVGPITASQLGGLLVGG